MKVGDHPFSNCKSLTYAYVNVHGVTMKQIFGDYGNNYLDTLDLGYRTVIEKTWCVVAKDFGKSVSKALNE